MRLILVIEQGLSCIDERSGGGRPRATPVPRHRLKMPFLARMAVCGKQPSPRRRRFFDVVVTVTGRLLRPTAPVQQPGQHEVMRKAERALELATPVREAGLASCCRASIVQAAEEGAERFRATVHRSEDGREIVAIEPKSNETVLVVVGPKGAHDGVEAGTFGDEQGAFVTLS